MLWWSVFTGLTAAAAWLAGSVGVSVMTALLLMRLMVGLGEATTLPNSSKVVASWMPPRERGIGNSMFLAGGGVGGAISPPLIVWIMSAVGWRWSFVICALPGIPLALIWWWYSRDHPQQHPNVNAAELAVIQSAAPSVDFQIDEVSRGERGWLRTPSIWMLVISYGFQGYVVYIFYTWFYLYIVTVRGFGLLRASYWSSIPFIAVALMTPLGGFVSDKLSVILGKCWSRRITVFLGTGGAGVLLLLGARIRHAPTAIILLGLAAGCGAFAVVNWWASINDISPAKSGTLSGVMNTAGNLGGMISPVLTQRIAASFGWVRALDFAAAVIFCAGALWFFIRPSTPVSRTP
jgi:ACS family glucarate transporter-like MFS transporter